MIIDVGDGSFIAGETPTELEDGQHWCEWCHGDGLEYDFDDYLAVCGACSGAGVITCTDTACLVHSALHPLSDGTS